MAKSILNAIQRALENDDSQSKWRRFLGIAIIAGVAAIAIRSDSANRPAIACALILSGAALFVGILTGFLFGIPKTLRRNTASGTSAALTEGDYQPNTNLEEISDWLTKMLVGVGLVELGRVPDLIDSIARYWEPCFGPACPRAFASGLIVYFGAIGFLLGYLWTRLALVGDFIEKDPRRLITQILQQVARSTRADPDVVERSPDRQVVTPDQVEAAQTLASLTAQSNMSLSQLRQQIAVLAAEYEALRASMPSGPERTRRMEVIASQMRTFCLAAYPLLAELAHSASPGERLAAITFLQARPNPEYFGWLAERLRHEKPFIGYHAAVALQHAARNSSPESRSLLIEALDNAEAYIANLPDSADRVAVINSARRALKEP
jgi:hypothetical protein